MGSTRSVDGGRFVRQSARRVEREGFAGPLVPAASTSVMGKALVFAAAARECMRRRSLRVFVASAMLLVVVFLFRFNTLSGRYGGFDNDHFAVLVRAQALADDELPLRDYEDYELRGIRPALAYLPSMWARRLVGESLLAEAVLCVALYLAAQLTFFAALTLSGSVTIGATVALVQVFAGPGCTTWPKLLIPAAFALLLVGRIPETWRAASSGVVIAVAFLVRHDYAVYLAAAWLAFALASAWRGSAIDAIRSGAIAGATTAALLLPGLRMGGRACWPGRILHAQPCRHRPGSRTKRPSVRVSVTGRFHVSVGRGRVVVARRPPRSRAWPSSPAVSGVIALVSTGPPWRGWWCSRC